MAHTHHDDYAAGEGFAAASWMMAMLAVIIAVVLVVALLVWAPWHTSNSTTGTNGGTNSEQQAPSDQGSSDNGGGVNIEGNDVNVGDNAPDAPNP